MTLSDRQRILGKIRNERNEAARHLSHLERQQKEDESFIPTVIYSIGIELADYIERCNERIRKLEEETVSEKPRDNLQLAFAFICEAIIRENEIPF